MLPLSLIISAAGRRLLAVRLKRPMQRRYSILSAAKGSLMTRESLFTGMFLKRAREASLLWCRFLKELRLWKAKRRKCLLQAVRERHSGTKATPAICLLCLPLQAQVNRLLRKSQSRWLWQGQKEVFRRSTPSSAWVLYLVLP